MMEVMRIDGYSQSSTSIGSHSETPQRTFYSSLPILRQLTATPSQVQSALSRLIFPFHSYTAPLSLPRHQLVELCERTQM